MTVAEVVRRCTLVPVITFVAGLLWMANHVYDVGPDSSALQVEMAGWLLHGSLALAGLVLAEIVRRAWLLTRLP